MKPKFMHICAKCYMENKDYLPLERIRNNHTEKEECGLCGKKSFGYYCMFGGNEEDRDTSYSG